jgi:hypothetical protein
MRDRTVMPLESGTRIHQLTAARVDDVDPQWRRGWSGEIE